MLPIYPPVERNAGHFEQTHAPERQIRSAEHVGGTVFGWLNGPQLTKVITLGSRPSPAARFQRVAWSIFGSFRRSH
jgi:hypothetical protein